MSFLWFVMTGHADANKEISVLKFALVILGHRRFLSTLKFTPAIPEYRPTLGIKKARLRPRFLNTSKK